MPMRVSASSVATFTSSSGMVKVRWAPPFRLCPSAAVVPAPATAAAIGSVTRLQPPSGHARRTASRAFRTIPNADARQKNLPPPRLVPEVHGGAALAQALGLRLQEALEGRLARIGAARDVLEGAGEMEAA